MGGPGDLLSQGLDPVLLVLSLQGTHPVLKQVTGEQLPGDTPEEVLEDEERVPFGLFMLCNVLVSLSQLRSISGNLCSSCHRLCPLFPAFD